MSTKDIALALLVAVLWGFTFVVIEVGLDSFPPLLFSALRFMGAAFPAVLFLGRGNVPWRLIVQVGVVFGVAYFALLFIGMDVGMPAGLSSLVVQSQALFTAVLSAVILRDPPVGVQKAGMAVAVAGLALIGAQQAGDASLWGLLLVILAAATWGVTNIIIKCAGQMDMFRLMVWMCVIPIVPLLLLSAVFETGQVEALSRMDAKGVGAVLYMGLVATVFCFGVWGRLLSKASPNVVAPFSLLVPVFGMSFSWVLLGEEFSVLKVVGSGIVFLGLVLNIVGRTVYDRKAARDVSGEMLIKEK